MDKYDKKRLDLIRKYEGYDANAYQLDGEDFHTIGYGSTEYADGSPVGAHDTISQEAAQKLLNHHIDRSRAKVSKLEGYSKLPVNAQVAVDSFAYNSGPNFIDDDKGFGTINKAIKLGNVKDLADALPMYDNGGLEGLVRRREEEARLALTPAMDLIDSTLANDSTRAFGTDAVLKGKPVKWGGKSYRWQSPESFSRITPPTPPAPEMASRINNLFGILR